MMPRRLMVGLVVALLVASLGSASTPAQRTWQADVRVQTLEVTELKRGGPLTARVVLSTESDDEARAVRLEIMLPIGVGVLRLAAGCHSSPSPVATLNARVTCDLGDMPVRGLRDVSITTSARPATGALRFAVFALSDTPDPAPANNFAERVIP